MNSDEKDEKYELEVPVNISTRNEFIKGLSIPDLARIAVVSIIAVVIAVILRPFTGMDEFGIVLVSIIVITVLSAFLSRSFSVFSAYDYIKIIIKYTKEPKHYPYIFKKKR